MKKFIKYATPIFLHQQHRHQHSGYRFVDTTHGVKTSSNSVADMLKSKRLIYIGEIHGNASIVRLQQSVLDFLVSEVRRCEDRDGESNVDGKVVVFMEHFAGPEHQKLLDDFMEEGISNVEAGADTDMSAVANLLEGYKNNGDEGHNLEPYANFLEYARRNSDIVELKAGFIPRSYARRVMKDGEEKSLEAARQDGFLDPQEPYMKGSENHYNFFESLISGRDMLTLPPNDRFRGIFPAQVIKDSAMAHMIVREYRNRRKTAGMCKFLIICGSGHCDYRFGVPERVDAAKIIPKEETCLISSRNIHHYDIVWDSNGDTDTSPSSVVGPFEKVEAFENPFPADIIYFYDDNEGGMEFDIEQSVDAHSALGHSSDVQIKAEIADAYNEVGATAHLEGDSVLASSVMKFLDYTDEQIAIAGRDAFNYQGVGNPHKHANIVQGNRVLDLGSGLGVDSFIAAERVGEVGSVLGLDISKGEVIHARKRAEARGVDGRVSFEVGDMEQIPADDGSIDVVISNGAFCLAPNKKKAFAEIFRVLKPGGHFSVACTTLLKDLEATVNWPICMRVFMPLEKGIPMLKELGFKNVEVDLSNSLMEYELKVPIMEPNHSNTSKSSCPEETESNFPHTGVSQNDDKNRQHRRKIHVGSDEFKHLGNFNMNELCARVIFHGKKP